MRTRSWSFPSKGDVMKSSVFVLAIAVLCANPLLAGDEKLILEINVFQGHRSGFPPREPAPPTTIVLPPDPGWSDDIERQRQQIAETLAFDGVAVVAKDRAEVAQATTHRFDVGRDWRFPYQVSVRPVRVGKTRVELDIRIIEGRSSTPVLSTASIQGEIGKTFIVAQNTPGNRVLVAVTPKLASAVTKGGETKTVGGDITQPRLLNRVAPRYPDSVRKEKVSGSVVIQAVVQKDGSVGPLSVVRPVHPDLDAAALEAVRQWNYEPARQNGQPVAVYLTITVD